MRRAREWAAQFPQRRMLAEENGINSWLEERRTAYWLFRRRHPDLEPLDCDAVEAARQDIPRLINMLLDMRLEAWADNEGNPDRMRSSEFVFDIGSLQARHDQELRELGNDIAPYELGVILERQS